MGGLAFNVSYSSKIQLSEFEFLGPQAKAINLKKKIVILKVFIKDENNNNNKQNIGISVNKLNDRNISCLTEFLWSNWVGYEARGWQTDWLAVYSS